MLAIKTTSNALGLLYAVWAMSYLCNYAELLGVFSATELKVLHGMVKKQLNCPMTTSIGRLFDAFSSLLGLCQISGFEGQAAMALEACAMNSQVRTAYPTRLIEARLFNTGLATITDWRIS
ncbi:MAG: hypothetical protein IPN55_18230 [Saprospiraceae bacterium]|nr:hypothetical protein [Candidatus Brachybacter algidus]